MTTSTLELAEILDAIAESIVVLNPDGGTLYANRAVLDYTGLTMPDVLAGDFLSRLFHPEDVVRLKDPRREGLSHGVPFEIEWRARRHDGQYRWFLVRYRPLVDDQTRVLRWYATAIDIDDRKRTELQNVIERGVVLCEGETFSIDDSWLKAKGAPARGAGGEQERDTIEAALAATKGRVAGPTGAAAKLGMPRQTLDSKIRALRIDKLEFRPR